MLLSSYGWLDKNQAKIDAHNALAQLRNDLSEERIKYEALSRSKLELLGDRYWPRRHYSLFPASDPGSDVAIVTVANSRFYRGLEAFVLSLKAVYPDLTSPVIVVHDGSLGLFLQSRLRSICPSLKFEHSSPTWGDDIPLNSRNRRRIGKLGYLNVYALGLRGYRRVVIFDSDILITGSLDPLWAPGNAFRAVPDCGDRPWAAVSSHTNRPIVNSGVLSLPGSALTSDLEVRMERLILEASEPVCPLLDCFADQKAWNMLLADCEVELLPINFNCNVKYLVKYLGGCAEGLSVVHFAGPKPWLTWPWVQPSPEEQRKGVVTDHLFWNRMYRELLLSWRLDLYRNACSSLSPLPSGPALFAVDPGLLLASLSLNVSRHVLIYDSSLFGGSWPNACTWPQGWIEALSQTGPVRLWAPFEWEPVLSTLPLPEGVDWYWLLIEAPFSPPLCEEESDSDADFVPCLSSCIGFEPCGDSLFVSLESAARRVMRRIGAEVLPLVLGASE